MMDPMADLGSSGATNAADTNAKEVFDPMALNLNLQRVDKIRTFMGIVSGCVAGVCGLTGLEGLGRYCITPPLVYGITLFVNDVLIAGRSICTVSMPQFRQSKRIRLDVLTVANVWPHVCFLLVMSCPYSVLCSTALVRVVGGGWRQDGIQPKATHPAILVRLPDLESTTKRSVVHVVLDALLRISLLVLRCGLSTRGEKKRNTSAVLIHSRTYFIECRSCYLGAPKASGIRSTVYL